MYETEVNPDIDVAESIELERSWADLPDSLLFDIFSRLADDRHQIVFSAVCKSWDSILKSPIPTNHQLINNIVDSTCPHLFFSDDKLIHPTLQKVYELKKFPERSLGIRLYAAKDDWLLITQNACYESYSSYSSPFKLFFFNPFTREMVWLPDLLDRERSMCFTSTSSGFQVAVVRNTHEPIPSQEIDTMLLNKIVIYTIKCGEDRWTSSEFVFKYDSLFHFSNCTPVLYKSICCILGEDSTLLIHDTEKKTFFHQKAPKSNFLSCGIYEQYLLESDGKLLVVFVEASGNWVQVWKWIFSERKWVKLEKLGDNVVLFVSHPYSLSETVSASKLGNRIYLPRLMSDRCLFYSLDTKRFHTSDGSSYTSFHGSKAAFSSTWIKPSRETLS